MSPLVAKGFEPVQEAFLAFCDADPTYNAQLAVHVGGEIVVDLIGGSSIQPDSIMPVYSSSKGAAAVVVGLLVQRRQLDLDARVASYWPEFAQAGKAEITVRQLLSHQAGLPGVDGGFSFDEVIAHTGLAERLAAQRPYWQPGAAFLYHALTIGTLADELVRRIDGRSVADVLRDDVTAPRGIDVWLGTPASEDARVVEAQMPNEDELLAFLATASGDEERDAITSATLPVGGQIAFLSLVNTEAFRRAAAPAACALASGRGLAKLYASVRHDVDGPRVLTDDTIGQLSQLQVAGTELGTGLDARFGILFQVPCPPRWPFGSFRAFGHDGAGGSLAFCDPTYDLAFGYTVQRLPLPGGMDQRAVDLTRVARDCMR